ncbi:hypothetical protein B0H15DRAFT_860676 [Mycena belliarum]|uniref:Uncharacterized protein n=1 Tax=Mycena belliarum TaxID=1033014 RepID=A0AAD6XKT5_9AGAR|nr:hypothetical protein B0H15DRAFT_860676 [Mycena belliae]
MTSENSRPCQAEDSDGDECGCEDFRPRICRRCLHTLKHHPQPEVQDTVSSIVMRVQQEHEAEADLLSKVKSAKDETLEGMRPWKPKARYSGSKAVQKRGVEKRGVGRPPKEPPSTAVFKVDAIILLDQGLVKTKFSINKETKDKKLRLNDDSIPDKAAIQSLVNEGLAYRKDGQIEISINATYEEVVDILSEVLPGPMRYLDNLTGLVVFEREGRSFKAAPWVLTTKVKQRLEVVPIALPTGRDLLTHRGSGSENRYIIIGKP